MLRTEESQIPRGYQIRGGVGVRGGGGGGGLGGGSKDSSLAKWVPKGRKRKRGGQG